MKITIRTILLAGACILVAAACDKAINLDSEQAESKVVIEGVVTNMPGYQFVKLSRSVAFYESGKTPRITDATVTVTDNEGNVYTFMHNPNDHEDSVGYYKPVPSFVGEVGRIYTLNALIDGITYEAQDELFAVSDIDSLEYQINEEEYDDEDRDTEQFYEVLLYGKEPQGVRNFYLFNFYRNDSLVVDDIGDIYVSDDTGIGDEISGVSSPVFYAIGDTARVEMLSLSRVGYVFYSDMSSLLNNDGGLYSPPPANARTNLSNDALGFFQASSVSRMGIRIE